MRLFISTMDFRSKLYKKLSSFNFDKSNQEKSFDTLKHVLIEVLQFLYDESPRDKNEKSMLKLATILNLVKSWDCYKTRITKELGPPKHLMEELFPNTAFNFGLILFGRWVREDIVQNGILGLKTEGQYREQEVLKILESFELSQHQFEELKQSVKIESYEAKLILRENHFNSSDKATEIINDLKMKNASEMNPFVPYSPPTSEEVLASMQRQAGVFKKHRNIQEFLFFVGTKHVFSKHIENYWRSYFSFLKITYDTFPDFFETEFDFNLITRDDLRKRIQYYERTLRSYPIEIANIWGLNEKGEK